ncbi:hypothetical protein GCM10007972_11290 [Iodidimonas muriae]|uniref:Uncharacterized protein n=1 Tax=Iodidimonas muriae TaxID=261467 RepID=A0ABQ2LBS6_9PROT|nr:hypothetical protein GCM10007972_11290 [Iodidimonas muriae]
MGVERDMVQTSFVLFGKCTIWYKQGVAQEGEGTKKPGLFPDRVSDHYAQKV